MITLDPDALRAVVAVASFGGVRRAAQALGLSQPAVSGQLRRLEQELGFPIVARQGRNIAFTARGEDVVREAHRLLDEHDRAVERLAGERSPDLRVISSEYLAEPLLRSVLRVLAAEYPSLRVGFSFHRSERVRELAHAQAADLALGLTDLGRGSRQIRELPLSWLGSSEQTPDPSKVITFTAPCAIRTRILGSNLVSANDLARECLDLTSLLGAVRSLNGVTALPPLRLPHTGLTPATGLPELGSLPLVMATSKRIGTAVANRVAAALAAA